jgi:hypothetical protein
LSFALANTLKIASPLKVFIMKFTYTHAFFMLCFVFLFSQKSSANVWRVNNNAGINTNFVQLSTAIANPSVQPGDTIYIEGSANAYNSATLNKRLVIIGAGYFLAENAGLQLNTNDAFVASISIDSLASGSHFYGIRLNNIFTDSNTDNITLARCHSSISTSSFIPNSLLSNWVINKCYINNLQFNNSSYAFVNLQVTNCFISGVMNIANNVNGLIRNNLFQSSCTVSNCYVANNIFINFSTLSLLNCTVRYNIAQANVLPAGNNNQNNITQASLFTLTGSTDGKYQLRPGSPAILAGEPVNGITPDAGPFGTDDPYRLSGIPPIPTIYALTVPSSVPSSATSMTITVSTRSNN